MFLSLRQLRRLWLSSIAVGAVGTAIMGLPFALYPWLPAAIQRRAPALVAVLAWPPLAWAAWLLTAGRRVAEVPLRPLWVAVLASVAAAALAGLLAMVDNAGRSRRLTVLCRAVVVSVVCGCLLLDSLVLRRLYPAFHWSLAGVALFASTQGARLLAPALTRLRPPVRLGLVAAAMSLAPLPLLDVADAPSLRFSIEQSAPITGKVLSFWKAPAHPVASTPAPAAVVARDASAPGITLDVPDVLLITVDALRADVLGTYGGTASVTPALDALSREAVVFERAYTTTPHTSYALTSLMTGKYMREVAALSEAPRQHPTLAQLLRRFGYRTAAFYPPAVFYVDGARFEAFEREQLGFEYAKVMFADAAARVPQLHAYLDTADGAHPLFVWVHLFDPHEPYQPPAEFARGEDARSRYLGEVAAADAAIGKLVSVFRAARPRATVIVSADHGEEFGEHGGQRHGSTLYDEQVRVPLLWSSPGVAPPGRVQAPVDLVDVATTVLGALDLPTDARMRGDDLGPLLADPDGQADPAPIAYAALDDAQMATDGRHKVICHRRGHCQLFDLQRDPQERRDVSAAQPAVVARLRGALSALSASIPRVEALALDDAQGVPALLGRARIGDASAADGLPALLTSPRPDVRASAAEACAALSVGRARPALERMAEGDPVPAVRAAAAVAALSLGARALVEPVAALLSQDGEPDLQRAAALSLVEQGDARGLPAVLSTIEDAAAGERLRLRAIAAVGALGDGRSVSALVAAMQDVRLRPAVDRALGEIGTAEAVAVLVESLAAERYPEARAAGLSALAALQHPKARSLLLRYLGTDTSVPGGLDLLLKLGTAPACGADLRQGGAGRGTGLSCDDGGCVPGAEGATLPLSGKGPRRLLLMLGSGTDDAARLTVDDVPLALRATGAPEEYNLPLGPQQGEVALRGDARVLAYACVPAREDVPPPPPEPWEPGDPPTPPTAPTPPQTPQTPTVPPQP